MLFSLLAWITTKYGGQSEVVYRIWSVVPATAAAGVIAWWAWRRVSPFTAVMTVLLTLAAPIHLALAPQARGYGLAFLAGAGMLVGAMQAGEDGRSRDIAMFAAFGAVGILTLPVFVLAFLAQGAVLVALPRCGAEHWSRLSRWERCVSSSMRPSSTTFGGTQRNSSACVSAGTGG